MTRTVSRTSRAPRPRVARGKWLWGLALVWICACGSAPPQPSHAAPPLGPLASLVPDGATLVLLAKPREVLARPALRALLDATFPPAHRERIAVKYGIDLANIDEALLAEFETGRLVIFRGSFPAREVVRAAELRMAPIQRESSEPFFRRGGDLEGVPWDVIALETHVVAFVSPMPDVVASLLSRAERGRFPGGASGALGTADGQELVRSHRDAAFAVISPVPLLPPGEELAPSGASLLFSRERAHAFSLSGDMPGKVQLRATLRGEFPDGVEDNLRSLIASLGATTLGGSLGIDEALRTLTVRHDEWEVSLAMEVGTQEAADGLAALFTFELTDLGAGTGEGGAAPDGELGAPVLAP